MELMNFSSKDIIKAIELEEDKLARKKLKAFLLVKEKLKVLDVANKLSICTNTLYSWIKQIKSEGLENLQMKKGRGLKSKLTFEQFEELKVALSEPIKTDDGYSRGWQSKDVLQHIQEEYEITYSLSRIRELLNNLGFKKIVCRPRNKRRNGKLTQEFLDITKKNTVCWVRNI